MIFGVWNPENILQENLTDCPPRLSDVATVTWEIEKSHFQQYYSYVLLIIYITSQENYPLANPTWKYHHTNLWIVKLFRMTEGSLRSFKRWRLWREPVVVCYRWLWKEPIVTCGNWNVRQAMSQQVFKVTTFCINTRFQSFSTLISRIVFSPCRNKPLPQAATCPYQCMRFSCSVPQTQY